MVIFLGVKFDYFNEIRYNKHMTNEHTPSDQSGSGDSESSPIGVADLLARLDEQLRGFRNNSALDRALGRVSAGSVDEKDTGAGLSIGPDFFSQRARLEKEINDSIINANKLSPKDPRLATFFEVWEKQRIYSDAYKATGDLLRLEQDRALYAVRQLQKKSLETVLEQLNSYREFYRDYPEWFRVYVWESIRRAGEFDAERARFSPRTETTTALFPELHQPSIEEVFQAVSRGCQAPDKVPIEELLKRYDFNVLYGAAVAERTALGQKQRQQLSGIWLRDKNEIYQTIRGQGTGWLLDEELNNFLTMPQIGYSRKNDHTVRLFATTSVDGKGYIPRILMFDGAIRGLEPTGIVEAELRKNIQPSQHYWLIGLYERLLNGGEPTLKDRFILSCQGIVGDGRLRQEINELCGGRPDEVDEVEYLLNNGYDVVTLAKSLFNEDTLTLGRSLKLLQAHGLENTPFEIFKGLIEHTAERGTYKNVDYTDGAAEIKSFIEGLSKAGCDLKEIADYCVEHGRFRDLFFPKSETFTPALRHAGVDMNNLSRLTRQEWAGQRGLYPYFLEFLLNVGKGRQLEPEVNLREELNYAMTSTLDNLIAVMKCQEHIAWQHIELDPRDLLLTLLTHKESCEVSEKEYPMYWVCRLVRQAYDNKCYTTPIRECPTPAEFWREIIDPLPEYSKLALQRAIATDRHWEEVYGLISGGYITEEDR